MAVRGLDFAARVSRIRTLEEPAGAFEPVEDAEAAECGGARGGVRPGAGVGAVVGSSEGQDAGGGRDDAGGERGDAFDRAARRRERLRGVAGAGGTGVGDRDADAGGACEAGSEAAEEGLQQGLGASARPGSADHEDEGRQDRPGPQVRAGGRHGDRGSGRGDGADDGRRRHGLAAEHAGRGGAAVGGPGGRASGGGGGQGLPLEQDDEGGEGPRIEELRERAQPRPPELEAGPGRAAADLRQPAADPGQPGGSGCCADAARGWSGASRTCSQPEDCAASTFAGRRRFESEY